MSPPSTWTDDQIRRLGELWIQGLSAARIGEQLGVSRGAVLGKLSRLGLLGAIRDNPQRPQRGETGRPSGSRPGRATRGRRPRVLREVATGAEARPWMSRRPGECAWPVAGEGVDVLACCALVGHRREAWAYCPAHRELMILPSRELDVEELLKRVV